MPLHILRENLNTEFKLLLPLSKFKYICKLLTSEFNLQNEITDLSSLIT